MLDLIRSYEIPYLHPLVVHFPFVLLLIAGAVGVVYLATGRALARHAVLAFLLAGALGAWWAVETGEALAPSVEGEPVADAVLGAHAEAAAWTLRLALVASALAVGATLAARRRTRAGTEVPARDPLVWRLAVAVAAGAAAVAVALAAHLGGIMVWGVPVP